MEDDTDEPSFGDLVAATSTDVINVDEVLGTARDQRKSALAAAGSTAVQLPSANSLGTVLNQALKTNDVQLLESCLQTGNVVTIRSTIQRLDSSLATTLLSKLAERMHRRPGRAGNLLIWIQWILVSHGGHLASQPDLMRQLAELYEVVKARASGLQPLLNLKGKLDMLEAQMQLRSSMQDGASGRDRSDDEDDERIIYVEGQEDDGDGEGEVTGRGVQDPNMDVEMGDVSSEEDDDDDDADMHVTANGVVPGSADKLEDDASEDESLSENDSDETDADSVDEGGKDAIETDQSGSSAEEEISDSQNSLLKRIELGKSKSTTLERNR